MSRDENDRAIMGDLPTDLTSDVERVNDVARIVTVRDMLETSLTRAAVSSRPKQCTSGIVRLDEATGGIRDGSCWLIGAETNWGKSQLATHLADENLRSHPDWEALIVSFEDPEEIYADRLMCRRARIDADHLRLGKVTPVEFERMASVAAAGERKPVFLDARDRSAEWAAQEVRRILDARPTIHLVIYDYLQEARSAQQHRERRHEVSYVAKILRTVVKRHNRACVLLSQLNEETGPNGFPTRASIAESRDPGKGAEVIVLGFTPTKDVVKDGHASIKAGTKCLYVDKVKQGRKGMIVPLRWNDVCACFDRSGYGGSDGDDDRYDRMAQEKPAWTIPRPGDIDDFSDLDAAGADMRAGVD